MAVNPSDVTRVIHEMGRRRWESTGDESREVGA